MSLSKLKNIVLVSLMSFSLMTPKLAHATDENPASSTVGADVKLELPKFSYSILKKGQSLKATRDTYLLTPETFARIVNEYDYIQRRYELHLDESLRLTKLQLNYKNDILVQQNNFLESELTRTNNLLIEVQRAKGKDLTPLWVGLSFVAGCALTVGLVYALEPGLN